MSSAQWDLLLKRPMSKKQRTALLQKRYDEDPQYRQVCDRAVRELEAVVNGPKQSASALERQKEEERVRWQAFLEALPQVEGWIAELEKDAQDLFEMAALVDKWSTALKNQSNGLRLRYREMLDSLERDPISQDVQQPAAPEIDGETST